MSVAPEWIAVDWGSSNLRAWAMGPEGVLAEDASEAGMASLSAEDYEPALLELIAPWLAASRAPLQVVICGMAGAKQGWREAPYRKVPCAPIEAGQLTAVATADPRIRVGIAPGLSQPQPADVMRGEETQIAGALALYPRFDGVICLPGTHSKWAHVSAGEVVSFQTFMTGEMFALLANQSVLRHGVQSDAWDDGAFAAAVGETLSRPERLASKLFGLRAEGLLHSLSADAARARLSGLLIGAELAAAKPYWLGQDVALIGAPQLSRNYAAALSLQGITARQLSGRDCTLAGLAVLAGKFGKSP